MTNHNLTFDTADDTARLTADKSALHYLRNAMFTAHYDGRMSQETAEQVRECIPSVSADGHIESATFRLNRAEMTTLAEGLKEAAADHRDNGRQHTADELKEMSNRVHFHTAKLPPADAMA